MHLELPTGQTLAVDRQGNPEHPAVIFLHGLSSNRHTWRTVAAHLLDRGGWQAVVVDQRGHGDSTHSTIDGYRAAGYAEDIAAIIELLELRRAVVVGHSLGGVVAQTLATSRPDLVRAVLLEDPPTFEGDADRREASPAAQFFPAMVAAVRELQAQAAPWEQYRILADPADPEEVVQDRLRGLVTWDPTTMETASAGVLWQGFDPVAPVPVPMTVLRADPEVGAVFLPADAELLQAANPDAVFVAVPGSDHNVHGPRTIDGFHAEFDRFLDTLAR